MAIEYYVFNADSEFVADGAVDFINVKLGPHQVKMVTWDHPKARDTDGCWIVKRVPIKLRQQVPQEVSDLFDSLFPHTIENYQSDWFNDEEEE